MTCDTMITRSEAEAWVKTTAQRFWDELNDPQWQIVLACAKSLADHPEERATILALAWAITDENRGNGSVVDSIRTLHHRLHGDKSPNLVEAVALRGSDAADVWRSACLLVAGQTLLSKTKALG